MKIDTELVEKRLKEGWNWFETGTTWYLLPPNGQWSMTWIRFSEDHYVPNWIGNAQSCSYEITIPAFKKVKIPRKLLKEAGMGYGTRVKITIERI